VIIKEDQLSKDSLIQPTLTIYPNPTSEIMILDITSTQPGLAEFKLYDLSGRLVTKQSFDVGIGGNSHSVNLNNLGLESGIYLIQLSAPGLSECRKIVFTP